MAVILIAEDEDGVRRFIAAVLSAAGHKVLSAANGVEAVALFRSNRAAVDLVITDMLMPVMGGCEAVNRIRETEPNVPVICMTGYTDQPIPANVQLLRKPFIPRDLLNMITGMLDQPRTT